MKRSRINQVIKDMENLLRQEGFKLPPFAFWTPGDWELASCEYDEIRDNKLGWDITDYGLEKFDEVGFALFTIRNGNQQMPDKYPKVYAEKVLMLYEGQYSPLHYHVNKSEDIINRGGNDVYITVYNGTKDMRKLDSDVMIHSDGRRYLVPAGSRIRLTPGESITITPYLFHDFIMPKTGGPVLLGEVSQCNDDEKDNYFYDPIGRFPKVEEDEAPYRLLCTEYPAAKQRSVEP